MGSTVKFVATLLTTSTTNFTVDPIAEHSDQHFAPGLLRVAELTGGAADSPYVLRPDFSRTMGTSQYAFNENNSRTITSNSASLSAKYRGPVATLNVTSAYQILAGRILAMGQAYAHYSFRTN